MHIQKHAPRFIGIGGKGTGLALLTRLLEAHPDVHGPLPNVGFFCVEASKRENIMVYEKALALTSPMPKSGECCPDYLTNQGAATCIANAYPDAKLFAIVRNPIDRAISEYVHVKATRQIPASVSCAQYMTNHPSAQTDGFYAKHLNQYFGFYSPLQLYVIVYEDFIKDPLVSIQKLYDFLELKKDFIPKQLEAFAPPPDEPIHPGRIKRLIRFIISRVKKLHPKKVQGPIAPPTPIPTQFLSPEELAIFKATFASDAAQLTHLLHRDMVVEWNLGIDTPLESVSK